MTEHLAMTAALRADHDVFQEPSPQASKCNSEDRLTSRNIAKSLNNSKILRENKFQEQRCESGETFAIFSRRILLLLRLFAMLRDVSLSSELHFDA